jgi:sugar diacid utilization regulator
MSTADAIGELAAIAAIDQSGRVGERTTTRSIADAAFPLLTVDDTARTEVYLGQLGIDLDAPAIVVAAGLLRGSRPDEDLRLALEDAIAPLAEPVVGIGSAGEALALVQPRPGVSDADVFESLTTSLRRIGPGLRRDRLTVGVSMRATIASIGGGVRTARSVRQLAVDERQPVEVVADSDLHTTRLLLNAVPDILRMAFVDRVLGPVISYDGRGTGDLLPTLATFFECNSSWSRTADRLGLHINTVRYRLARIEQLTGRTIAQSDDWVDLYAALTLRRSAG